MPCVNPLPFKGPPSFCLLGSYQLPFPLCILWEHSPPQLPILCPGNFLRSNPARFFSYLSCLPYDGKIFRNLASYVLSVMVEYLYQEHWQMLQIPRPIISPV